MFLGKGNCPAIRLAPSNCKAPRQIGQVRKGKKLLSDERAGNHPSKNFQSSPWKTGGNRNFSKLSIFLRWVNRVWIVEKCNFALIWSRSNCSQIYYRPKENLLSQLIEYLIIWQLFWRPRTIKIILVIEFKSKSVASRPRRQLNATWKLLNITNLGSVWLHLNITLSGRFIQPAYNSLAEQKKGKNFRVTKSIWRERQSKKPK